jgi:hypothetical protein
MNMWHNRRYRLRQYTRASISTEHSRPCSDSVHRGTTVGTADGIFAAVGGAVLLIVQPRQCFYRNHDTDVHFAHVAVSLIFAF